MNTARLNRRAALGLLASAAAAPRARAADPLRLGLLHTLSPAPFYIAQERGYFRDAGIDLTFRFFQAAQPIAAAAVAGDIDVGVTALTGGFFNLAAKGALKVIGGALHEQRGYEGSAILVSNQAFEAGLTALDKLRRAQLRDHPVRLVVPLHAGPHRRGQGLRHQERHAAPGAAGGQHGRRGAERPGGRDDRHRLAWRSRWPRPGEAHIIGWVGDIVPYQITALFTTERMIAQHADLLHRFAGAYQHGVGGLPRTRSCGWTRRASRSSTPATDAAIPLITKYVFTGDPNGARRRSWTASATTTPAARWTWPTSRRSCAWFAAQGLVKGDADPPAMIDTRFLPTR